jgi:hypothetical protein
MPKTFTTRRDPARVAVWLEEARQHLAHAENALIAAALAAEWRDASAISRALDRVESATDILPV